jgi:hypothetical protein
VVVVVLVVAAAAVSKVVPMINEEPHNEDVLVEWRYSYTHS